MPSTKPDDGVVLQNGEKVTLYFDVKLGKEGQPKTRDMFISSNLLLEKSPGPQIASTNISLRQLDDETSDLHRLICLAHTGPMYGAIQEHQKKLNNLN